jgi:DNA adenine methylase
MLHNTIPIELGHFKIFMRNILRWAGSKRQLLPTLAGYWQGKSKRYIEPFAGSAALFFHVRPSKALLGDINGDLIGFYKSITSDPATIYKMASELPATKEAYYEIRKKYINETNPKLRATYFLFLNRHCFNGIYRTNMKGEFNVPFSGNKTGNLPSWSDFMAAVEMLDKAQIMESDFEELLIQNVEKMDFVYLDPPYAVSTRRVFSEYGADSFSLGDLPRLQSVLREINSRGAKFLLSYAYSKESIQFFDEWQSRRVVCQRNIAGFASSRRKAIEMLATNFKFE